MQRHTIVVYLLYQFFRDFALVYPVYVIYFQQVGLSYLHISWLLAIWAAAVLILEVPSGFLADLWSRKRSLALGMVFKSLGFLVWLLRPEFWGFAAGFILWGVQEAISTGTTDALLYDSLKESGQEARFVELSGKGLFAARGGVVVSVLLGGWVFSWSPAAVMLVSAGSMLVAAVCAALLPEPSAARVGEPVAVGHQLSLVLDSVRAAATVKGLVPLVVFGSLAVAVYGVLDEYDFLFARQYGLPLSLIGVWGAGRFILEGLGAAWAHRIEDALWLGQPRRLAVWMAAAGLLLSVAVWSGTHLLLPLYFVFFSMMAAAEVIFQGWVQHRVESAGRATVSSMVSFVYEAAGLLLILLSGAVAGARGLSAVFFLGGLLAVIAAILFLLSVFFTQR